jgi:hypothetical protein
MAKLQAAWLQVAELGQISGFPKEGGQSCACNPTHETDEALGEPAEFVTTGRPLAVSSAALKGHPTLLRRGIEVLQAVLNAQTAGKQIGIVRTAPSNSTL